MLSQFSEVTYNNAFLYEIEGLLDLHYMWHYCIHM